MKSKLSFLARSVIVICMLVVGCSQAWAENAIYGSWDSWQKHTVSDNKVSVTLEAGATYEFYLFDSGMSGNESHYFKNYGTMTSSNCSNWKFEEGDNVPNCRITTGTAGTYEFNVSWDGSSPYITVTYPPRTYNGTEVLYLNAGVIPWWQDQGVAQYAYITNTSGTTSQLTGVKVEGTSVYAFTVPAGDYTKVYFQRGIYNKTGDINLAGTDKNYVKVFTENGTTVTWDTYTPPVTKFYLSYDGNGATGGTVPATVTNLDSEAKVTVVDNTGSLVKAGYHFDKWNTQADGAGTNYAANDKITITANTTLYAKWAENPSHTVSVTYVDANGSVRITDIAGVEKNSFREGETVRMIVEPYDGWAIATVNGATLTSTPGVYEVVMGTDDMNLSVGFEVRVADCYIYTSTSQVFKTPASGTNMTYVSAQKAYYTDVNGVSGNYYYRFNYNGVEYSCNWTTYPAGVDVTLGGNKVSSNKEVASWENKSACHYNGDGTDIRIWFDPATMQTWITKQGATAAFTPAAGSYDDKMTVRLKITLTEMAATDQTFNYDITGTASKSGSITVPGGTTSASDAIYDITSNGTYTISVKDAESTVIGSATYTINIVTKHDVKVTSKGHGSVSPTNPRVGESPVTITAKPETGYQFKQWTATGGVSITDPASATTTITAEGPGTVSAEFEEYVAPEREYYLVGNFFNVDGNNINYDRRYFMFKVQNDGSYMVEIPAAVTAKAQILGVEGSATIKFGPNETIDIKGSQPTTDNSKTGKFASSSTNNYWNLITRNDGTHDDDGLYEVSFILNDAGEPTDWTWKHVSTKRVAYFLSNAEGATANPVYDKRNNSTSNFSNKTFAMVYIDPDQTYYTIGYVLKNNEDPIIAKASAYGAHKNKYQDVLPTTNKLFLLGNGGREFRSYDPYNEVSPNEAPIAPSNKAKATYTVEYNPSNGQYEKAMWDSHLGIRGQFMFIGGNAGGTGADDPIEYVSLVGDPVGTWDYTSTSHDMTYNEKEGCYEITINTTLPESAANKFRFCANHNPVNTWYEDGTSGTTPKKLARVPYKSEVAQGHSCMPTDPNTVLYSTSNTTANHDIDMIFNRPAGTWTVRLYIDIDQNKQKTYRYTITGKENNDIPLTYVKDKFVRTYSNSVSMDLTEGMKAYEAYVFEDAYKDLDIADNKKDVYSNCKVYLRELKYIPANMGVVLVGNFSGTSGERRNFTLQTRIDEDYADYRDVWVRGDAYIANGDQWNNFLVPTVTANNNLGNASYNGDGNVTYRHFGLSNYYSTAYYQKEQKGEDYLGFFRLADNGRSGANKAYLSIPSSMADGWTENKQNLYGVLNYNAQLSGQETDENGTPSLAKAMILFDDILFDEEDNIVTGVMSVKQNADNSNVYYNMQGVRVLAPTKGLYISNGKKIVIK